MNEISDLKMMTTAELAEVFGVGESTVKRAIEKVRPELGGVYRNNQGGYLFTEQQALLLKNEIAGHHNLANRQIDTVTSALEENEVIASAIMILQRRSEEYRQRAELAEQRAIVAETMNNRLMHTSKLYTVTEIAKEAGMKSAEALNRGSWKKRKFSIRLMEHGYRLPSLQTLGILKLNRKSMITDLFITTEKLLRMGACSF